MKQKTPKSSLKILDQTFPLHARVRALSLFWSSLSSPLSTMQLPIFRCVYPTWADNECACLAPSLPLSLSSLLRSKIITVKSTIIMGDFSSLTPQRKKGEEESKKGKGGEITRKKKQQRRERDGEGRGEKSALMSLMAVACSEGGRKGEDDWHCFAQMGQERSWQRESPHPWKRVRRARILSVFDIYEGSSYQPMAQHRFAFKAKTQLELGGEQV